MTENASQFVGEIPRHYDQGLGPVLFDGYAQDLAARAAARSPQKVLELAAGTGIVSRRLRDALPASAHLTVTDLNEPMLEIARARFREGEAVDFQQADAMALSFADASFDLVVCQFGVMFFPDKVQSHREVRRVLKPGGAYLFNAWGNMDENPFSKIADELGHEFFPDDPPAFYRVPFSYPDLAQGRADLEAAEFSKIEAESVNRAPVVKDFDAFANGLVFGNPFVDEIRSRGAITPEEMALESARRLRVKFGKEPASIPLSAGFYAALA